MASTVSIDGTTYVLADDGTAYRLDNAPAAPAESAPAEPVGAMPFEIVTATRGGTAANPWPESMQAAFAAAAEGSKQKAARRAAALNREPGYACNALTVLARLPDGTTTNVGHGALSRRASGEACKTAGCSGTIL